MTDATEKRELLDMYIEQELGMMVACGAIVAAKEMEHGWWCIQFAGEDPALVEHGLAMMLAAGFGLGTKHYHDYRRAQRELKAIMDEDAEEA